MPSTTMSEQLEQELPPPPYPPPLPIALDQYETMLQPLRTRKPGSGFFKKISKSYNSFIDKTPELVAYVQRKLAKFRTNLMKLFNKVKNRNPAIVGTATNNLSKLKHQGENATERVVHYVLEDAPLYSAFYLIGGTAIALSLFLALIVSPSIWLIILLAGLLQIATAYYLKTRNR